jgi:hypothetical protein
MNASFRKLITSGALSAVISLHDAFRRFISHSVSKSMPARDVILHSRPGSMTALHS